MICPESVTLHENILTENMIVYIDQFIALRKYNAKMLSLIYNINS
jgi:hypothetical protein